MKKYVVFRYFIVVLSAAMMFSGCNTTEKLSEEETVSETTAVTLSEEELDALAENMPEIVFVMSYQAEDENIFGCYVMNTGIIKLFDFREIAPDEVYDVRDVYDRLEEAGCERLEPRAESYMSHEDYENRLIAEDELNHLSQDELIGYYKRLLLIDGNAEYIKWGWTLDGYGGYYKFYGIKENDEGVKECILLSGYGTDSEYTHSNPDATKMYVEFLRFLPDLQNNALS